MAAMTSHPAHPVRSLFWRIERRVLITIVIIVVVLVAARLAAPYAIRSGVNHRLAKLEGYNGHVDDIHLGVWRGAYQLRDLVITRRVGDRNEPFLTAKKIDFSLAWRELFHGRILADIEASDIEFVYVPVPKPEKSSTTPIKATPWQDVIKDIFPIDITRLTIRNGRLSFQDDNTNPPVNIALEKIELIATGLRNRPTQKSGGYPAHLSLSGTTIGGGRVALNCSIEPLAAQPHFDLDAKIEGVSLPALNSYLRAYGKVDVSAGIFNVYSEMRAVNGGFEGYVKPFFQDVEFKDLADDKKNIAQKVWEKIVAGFVTLVKNKQRDQLATRIPFQGKFGDTQVGVFATIRTMFHHGFIKALTENIEGSPDPKAKAK